MLFSNTCTAMTTRHFYLHLIKLHVPIKNKTSVWIICYGSILQYTHTPLTAATDQIDYFNLILSNQFSIKNEQNQNQMNVMSIFVRKTHEYCVN